MKFWALIPATVFLVTKVNAIALDVREVPGSDWIYTTVQDGVCHNFDNPIIQYYLDPGSNGGKSFLCRIFNVTDCAPPNPGLIPSDHPGPSGELEVPRLSVLCWTACCWP